MNKFDVVIVDSGVNKSHPILDKKIIHGISIDFESDGSYRILEDFSDDIGHGTAVYYLISKYVKDEKVLNLKAFSGNFQPDTYQIITVLKYIYENIECKIIHLSNGIVCCDEIYELHDICQQLEKKGIIIVSAFENTGVLSYPAVFEEVIGVDWSIDCIRTHEFEVIEGNLIDIKGIGSVQRLPWMFAEYKYVSGSSFTAPHVTGLILQQNRCNGLELKKSVIMNFFKKIAKKIYDYKTEEKEISMSNFFSIKKAVAFPYNKETDALIRYGGMLKFDIVDFYDLAIRGNIGRKLESFSDVYKGKNIKNYNEVDWNSNFDTFILGHSKQLSKTMQFDFIKDILEKCIIYEKNIFCFDSLSDYTEECDRLRKIGRRVYFPDIQNISNNCFGKLYCIGKPVLMISGTGSQQGKFSLQLKLRNKFMQEGYQVGQLGTEPSSLLFGMDEVFPSGYGSDVTLSEEEIINVVNMKMHHIEEKNPDIILVGTQSHILQNNMGNLTFFPLINYAMLLAIDPDAIVLCINYGDSVDYIERCINFLQCFVETTVLGLVIFPLKKEREWKILSINKEKISASELNDYKNKLSKQIHLPVYLLDNEEEIENLYYSCIDFWGE